ncbi:hypothetical protein MNAN1_001734 [Malassezia nana]|uniref:Uncharacterized protein n=1 Tax=Malassezia nana TaxID=180528 RepID=A0AAF0EJC1_9BASI|nr:hypothetical protein MNAN1_001734 [Malassezia nana]
MSVANHYGIGLFIDADPSVADSIPPVDIRALYSNMQMRMPPRRIYGTRYAWSYMLPRPTLRPLGYTRDDDEPLPPRLYMDAYTTTPAPATEEQGMLSSMETAAPPVHATTFPEPYASDATYTRPYSYEMVGLALEHTPSPPMVVTPVTPLIHVDEAKLYRTTHKGSTISYHLPSGTRLAIASSRDGVEAWESWWS